MRTGARTAPVMSAATEPGLERSEGSRSEPSRSGEPGSVKVPVRDLSIPDPEVSAKAQRRRFSAEYKTRIVREAEKCRELGEIGALLRREGLYSSHLVKWRSEYANAGLAAFSEARRGRKSKRQPGEIERLRRENAHLEQRLRQAERIIEIQKKVSEILSDPRVPIQGSGESD